MAYIKLMIYLKLFYINYDYETMNVGYISINGTLTQPERIHIDGL